MVTKKLWKKIQFIDLFAWIWGFHVALHNLGWECVFASEWDSEARKTYEYNHKKISKELFDKWDFAWDITKVDEKSIPDFNLLCAGFPCQPFSQAWFKKWFWETRGTLFFDIVRIIKEKQPEAFFLENVRHLLKHDDWKTFATIQRIIREELGYSFFYKIVKASDFGLPQWFDLGIKTLILNFQILLSWKQVCRIFGDECVLEMLVLLWEWDENEAISPTEEIGILT